MQLKKLATEVIQVHHHLLKKRVESPDLGLDLRLKIQNTEETQETEVVRPEVAKPEVAKDVGIQHRRRPQIHLNQIDPQVGITDAAVEVYLSHQGITVGVKKGFKLLKHN